MERLTKRLDDGQAVMRCEDCKASWMRKHGKPMEECTAMYCRNRVKDRLAEYEDTGYTPEEIAKLQATLIVQNAELLKTREELKEHYDRSIGLADALNSGLRAENEKLAADRKELKNELCQYCGKYKQAHEGACDGCKWREM